MGYLIFRGYSTENLPNVYVSKMPDHKKASQRFSEYYVKGRDGALHINEGYANYDIVVRLVMINASAATRQLVNAWADGTGKLITSDDLTKAYKATVEQEIEWTRVQANTGFYDTATITFNCQPFMVEAIDSHTVLTESGTLENSGNAEAFPLITVEGVGNVSFNIAGYPIEIDGMESGVPVTIDCENGYIYAGTGSATSPATMRGEIPKLTLGTNTITFVQNVSSITITPHWRWV